MTTRERSYDDPERGHIEMQQAFLTGEQARISNMLFEFGVVSRIVEQQSIDRGDVTEVKGLAQLDKLFVPALSKSNNDDRDERILSLAAISFSGNNGRGHTYFSIGMLDDTDTLYPFPGVDKADAEAVHAAAAELAALREDGTLPNLNFSLLGINNPYKAITNLPPKE